MIRLFQRLLLFSGLQKKRLIRSFLAYLVSSFFEMIPIMAILTVLTGILKQLSGDVMPESTIWISLGIMIVSIVGRIVFVNLSANARTLGSFAFGSEKRMEIGERLKKAPMGYFNENRLGDITAAVTTTLGDLEQQSVTIMENVAGGFIHAIVIGIWLMIYEWRIGLISLAGLAVALIVYSFIGKVGRKYAPRRQAAQAGLVTAVLEYVQGMGVVKAFGLAERTGKAVDAAIEESKEANIVLEKAFSKMTALYQTVFKLARAAILVFAPYLLAGGSITPEKCLLLLVSSFMIYAAVEVAGSMSSIARAVEASLDRLDNIMDIPSLDENGADLVPENFNIEVKNMSFGYGKKEVLHQISLSVPQGSSCAIVGPSGAGKTTLVGLIARFWDVKEGQITLGGRDVREYTSGSLLKNFAIVFQNVYLFEDTVENNIRFGRPDASEDEIIAVAKKACCHDFIMTLPDGYQTKIGEGGSSLSGGEKQRISIARAKPAGSLVITDTILNRVTLNWKRGKRTHVFIDEFHVMFENEQSGIFFNSAWRQFRKRGAYPTAITQNVEYLLDSVQASTMLSNSEFIVMLNQAASDRAKLAKLLNISNEQMSYVTNADAGCGLIRYGSALVPFINRFPRDTKLYALMTTKPGEGVFGGEEVPA